MPHHTMYLGMHPVSWFILLVNVAVTIIEWQFLVSQFLKVSKPAPEESKPAEKA